MTVRPKCKGEGHSSICTFEGQPQPALHISPSMVEDEEVSPIHVRW